MSTESDSPLALRVLSYVLRAGVALVVLLAGVGIAAYLVGTRPEPVQSPRTDRVISVRAIAVRPIALPRVWEGYGTARAMESADVSAQVSARVIERPETTEPGLAVEAGQVLVRLDPVDFAQRVEASRSLIASWEAQIAGLDVEERRLSDQLELMQDEVRLEERELERVTSAVEQRGANALEIERRQTLLNRVRREMSAIRQQVESIPPRREQTRALLANERAALRMAEENLERTVVRAPISGVLQHVAVEPGELLAVGAAIARIVSLSRVEVPLRLPISASERLRVGDDAEMWADSPSEGAQRPLWRGRIVRIAPEADAASRTLTAFVEVVQEVGGGGVRAGLLLPGQFVVGHVTTASPEERSVVPRNAVDGDRVMVVENGTGGTRARSVQVRVLFHARRSLPELDPAETEWAVLESGPPPGSLVITTNLDELRDGTPVRVQAADAVAGDGAGAIQPGGGS